MEDNELISIAKDYYDFIIKYEKYLNKIHEKPKVDKNFKMLFEFFDSEYNKYYRPWLTLTKGKEIEELYEIFSTFNDKSIIYSDVASRISDDLIDMGERDLQEYLKMENYKIVCKNLLGEEVENEEKMEFSKETLTLLKYYKILNPICERLYSYINKVQKQQERGDFCL